MSSRKEAFVSVGAFVKVTLPPYDTRGIGKLMRVQGGQAVVSYFDVPDAFDQKEVVVPVMTVKVVDLPEQTRVFHLDQESGRWQVGRVLDGIGEVVLVQFPNQQIDNLPREELNTRWRRPIADPVAFLSRRVNETPLFAEARAGFVRSVIAQRAATLGMGAVLSSSIQLADYQFSVVRRVLQDPVQRYLLADEVGLGKTVEAGILIRQYILDEAKTAYALVVVPPPLVSQWKHELADRFHLAAWLDDFVHVVASDDLEAIENHIESAGMLVVDEAHHLSRLGNDGRNSLYDVLNANAQRVPRLLLLSATPVLSDTAGFLRVLHLLDPVVFPLDDLAGFERRLQSRQLVAETVAALVPENVLSMEDDLDRLQEAFPDDETLESLMGVLRPIVQSLPDEEDESFRHALAELRFHLTETYKLHRRILRNRRKSVPWATPRRSGVSVVEYDCAYTGEFHRALNAMRVRLANIDAPGDLQYALFAAAVHPEVASGMQGLLRRHGIQDSLTLDLGERVDHFASEMRREAIRARVLVETVERLLLAEGQQLVVFCDRVDDADLVAEGLRRALPAGSVQRHGVPAPDEDAQDGGAEAWQAFLRDPIHCRVLVCDARAEEGLNLHGGKKIAVHFDLPSAPNRIEQRLGRLDRFGAGDAIKSVVLVCRGNKDEAAWFACLHEGLQVFSASIASLQYLLEETLRTMAEAWSGEGEPALLRWREQLAGASGWVTRERRRIDQQDALDALGEVQSDAFDNLEAVDAEWQAWREAFDAFAVNTLQFQKRLEHWEDALPAREQVFRLGYSREPRASTLMTLNAFIMEFLGTIDTEAPHSSSRNPLTFAYAYRRNTALSKRGTTRKVRPLRFGDALVESMYSFCESDDRGRIYAMWRHLPSYEPRDASNVDLFFRFDFLVEADLVPDGQPEDDSVRALRRRVDGHFPPQFQSLWVLPDKQCTTEPPPALLMPYSPRGSAEHGAGRDYNVNARRWQLLDMQRDIPWTTEWSRHCEEAKALAKEFLAQLEEVRDRVRRGLNGLKQQHDARAAQLTARATRLQGAARDAELAELRVEDGLHGRLVDAVGSPHLRLDSAGAVFVAPRCPFTE